MQNNEKQHRQFRGVSIGQRIHITGNSCSGKTALGTRLAVGLGAPFVELDALNWQEGWVSLMETDLETFEQKVNASTQGDRWVVAGSYMGSSQRVFWPRLETVIWLDLPLHLLIWRMFVRSWRRWRAKELLWGTNYERFWPQFAIWRKEESLLWWIVTQHHPKRRNMFAYRADPKWKHIQFVHLRSVAEIEEFSHAIDS